MADLTIVICVAVDHRACPAGFAKFKDSILKCPLVDYALEVSGTFDWIVQVRCSSLVEYSESMDHIRSPLAEFVTRFETNFVARRLDHHRELEEGGELWLPCEHGLKRVDAHSIDKITAEGDYMRVHVGEWDCLVRQTMHRLSEQLDSSSFVQLNRSALVRIDFVERLVHDQWRWKAQLRDGTQISVAKGHVKAARGLITGDSPNRAAGSSGNGEFTDKVGTVNEIRMKTLS